MAKRLITVNDILAGHVSLDVACLDRIYLNGYLPTVQVPGQVVQFLQHRGFPIPSPAVVEKMGTRFRDAVKTFAEVNRIPVVRFGKNDRKLSVMQPHLDRQAATGRAGVAAIGVAQEFQRVFTAATGAVRAEGGAPHFSWGKADRRVTAYYFYLWDEDFGPGFIKICAYFPYPIKICLLTELPGESAQLRGQVGVLTGTVPTRDRFRGAGPGPAGVGGSTVGCAAGRRGPVRAVSAA